MEVGGGGGVKDGLDHEDEFGAALLAVNDGRRVFGLGRNEGDLAGNGLVHAIHGDADGIAGMNRPDPGFLHEGADLDVFRRKQGDHRAAGGDPFARAIKRVKHKSGRGRGLAFLGQIPFRTGQGGLEGADGGFGGGDLVVAGAGLRGLQIGCELGNALAVLVPRGAGAIQVLLRGAAGNGSELFLAGEFLAGQGEGGLGLIELGWMDWISEGRLPFFKSSKVARAWASCAAA